jgi:hypothetical protein
MPFYHPSYYKKQKENRKKEPKQERTGDKRKRQAEYLNAENTELFIKNAQATSTSD